MMILRGMPRKRARPLDGFAALASNGDSYEQIYAGHTSGTTDSGSLDVGVVPFRPAAPVIYMPGKPIAPPQEQPKPYAGEPPPVGYKMVPWTIRDKTGRIINSGYRKVPVERTAPVRREVEVEIKIESPEEKQARLDKQLAQSRLELAERKQQAARDYADRVFKYQAEAIERKYTNPYKKEDAMNLLRKQYSVYVDRAAEEKKRTLSPVPGSDLASVIAAVQYRYDKAVGDGMTAMRKSPGISPLGGDAWGEADAEDLDAVISDTAAREYARRMGMDEPDLHRIKLRMRASGR